MIRPVKNLEAKGVGLLTEHPGPKLPVSNGYDIQRRLDPARFAFLPRALGNFRLQMCLYG